jgi:hypothetical protein
MPVRASLQNLSSSLLLDVLGLRPPFLAVQAREGDLDVPENQWRCHDSLKRSRLPLALDGLVIRLAGLLHVCLFQGLTSDQVGIPAELKHINKRRKRNQQGLP